MTAINPHFLAAQISALRLQYPDLQDDDELWALSIESQTLTPEVLQRIERKRAETAAMAAGVKGYIDELEHRRIRFERREKALRDLAFRVLDMTGLRKIETPEATYSIAAGQQRVIITDEAALPDELCRIKREPDKKRIAEWLKTGIAVPGAALSNAEPHLTIRTR